MEQRETNKSGQEQDKPAPDAQELAAPAPQPPGTAELRIEKLVYGGNGLGRIEGQVVLAPFVLPGETVRVRIERERRGLLEADLLRVLDPAPGRTEPPCPYFYRCGGCQYQHAEYEVQLEQKRAILEEVLRRVGKLDPQRPDILSGPPWEYRNRTQFHLERGEIGYFEFGSHRLCPVDHCPISSPKINSTLTALRGMLRDRRFPRFVRSLELFTNETDVQLNVTEAEQPVSRRFFEWCAAEIPGLAAGTLKYQAGQDVYRVGHRSFFQVNRFLIEPMVERALEGAEGETAFDLYAGVGLFSLPLARRIHQVTAVESGSSAVRDLEFNAARAGVPVTARQGMVDLFLGDVVETPDFVLADPPRPGLGKAVVRELLRLRPPRLTIVSCDPATLARDLAPLVSGGFAIERLTLVDLFPQSFHLETIARLRYTR